MKNGEWKVLWISRTVHRHFDWFAKTVLVPLSAFGENVFFLLTSKDTPKLMSFDYKPMPPWTTAENGLPLFFTGSDQRW